MEILERAGVLVENENVLDIIEKAGGEIEKKRGIAKIPEYVIKGAIQKVPQSLSSALARWKGNQDQAEARNRHLFRRRCFLGNGSHYWRSSTCYEAGRCGVDSS